MSQLDRGEENKAMLVGGPIDATGGGESTLKRFLRCERLVADEAAMMMAQKRPRPAGWRPNVPEVETAAQALHSMAQHNGTVTWA